MQPALNAVFLSPVYNDTTQLDVQWSWVASWRCTKRHNSAQLNSTASCRSADGASAVLNVVIQLK